MNVLIVDDEPAVRRVEARVLEAAGHRCTGVGSVAEAMEVLNRDSIDVTLADIGLPGENGFVLARLIQRDFPHVAVIMVTALPDFMSVREAREAGAIDYLVKPVDSAALVAAVTRVESVMPSRALPRPSKPVEPPPASAIDVPIDRLFHAMYRMGASDLHLSATMPPMVRKDGEIVPLDAKHPALSAEDIVQLLTPIVPGADRIEFGERHDADFAYEIPGLARFRANIFTDRNGMGAVFRTVPTAIASAEQLGLPPQVIGLCELRKGLVLVTGPTGSGKSTTMAALIDRINRTRTAHIVTIEDPIEFVHTNRKSLINQREVHTHTASYKTALRAALREDPDVVLIGELRDLETMSIALETAETGHLVFGTLHTTSAASTVDRIIDQFPPERQPQIRVMLAESLKGVIAQTLCRRIDGGRVAALEVLMVNAAISNLIREGKTFQIPAMMQVGKASGMTTLNDALLALVRSNEISAAEGLIRAIDKPAFEAMLARLGARA
jgi:twitching motility protein PilT